MSKYEFKLPDIGEGIAEGTIGEWHVQPGDKVEEDGDLVQIENDKSVEEIPSPVSGTISKILVPEGDTASVGDPLVEIEVAGDVPEDAAPAEDAASSTPEESAAPAETPAPAAEQPAAKPAAFVPQDHSLPVLAMPAVRAFAREHDVDIAQIKGTGNHGQVLKSDVENFLQNGGVPQPAAVESAPAAAAPATPAPQPIATDADWPDHREKMSGVRKATAKTMAASWSQIPHFHLYDDVVVDKLWDHRKRYKEMAAERGIHLTFMAYITKALAIVMKEFPVLNASLDLTTNEIVYHDYVNVGIATDTDKGLFVPNVKDADKKSLFALARDIADNATKARDGKLTSGDMAHTGMSITNIGSLGGGFFSPLIAPPNVAILGMGKIVKEPVVVDDQIQIARVLKLSMAFDHRIIDGGTGQRAMNRLKELLSDPALLLMEG
ncbi:dihydrolipoamide acetyltransferase family protein [Ligilactobacillus hohenheimensis]|uniref:dihydrolipoamide acetyltransferase family protein n=1 Tax=Ligilactobacillus hohenheimensis TaxID=2991832 RepID=UPI0024B99907|nr:dihydrolipoamide acetyltransferase family protein [Ligilactobacillus hohenheimensis]